jgi:hypothetical protein
MSWYKISFSDAQVRDGDVRRLTVRMSAAVTALGDPQTDALLLDAKGAAGQPNQLFFSPEAARLAPGLIAEYGAVPCPKPWPDEVSLLVGRIPGYSRFKGVVPPRQAARRMSR